MKKNILIILAAAFVAGAAAAERMSARYVQRIRARRLALMQRLKESEVRAARAALERSEYEAISALAESIVGQLKWEPDSTRLIRWFMATAYEVGVCIKSAKVLPADRSGAVLPGGMLRRDRFEVTLQGSFWPLVRFVERVERSPAPMIVESFTFAADRDEAGRGDLKLIASCLTPVAQPAASLDNGGEQ